MTNSQWDENAPGGGRASLHHPPLLLRLLPVELLRWRRQVAQLQQEMLVFCILDIFISMLNARGPVAICTFDIQMNSSHAPCSEIKSFEIVNIISCINTHTHTERHHYLCNKKKKTNATTQCNNYHVTERPHVPIRPCSSSFWDKRVESLSISNIDFG